MTGKTVAIIGAGPAGLTCAYQLAGKGLMVEVFEAANAVGGMAKTIPLWGQLVDLGPHRFFSNDPRVNKIWSNVISSRYSLVNRLTRIYYRNRFFDYPLKASNAVINLGFFEAALCVLSYLKAGLFPEKDESTFEAWVANRFGRRLFNIFFKAYSEKLWGLPCSELDADFAAQRIKKFSLSEAIKSALFGSSGSKHKTLVDEFAYPHLGTGFAYDEMAKRICDLGGRIHLGKPAASVRAAQTPEGKAALILEDGSERPFDFIVSSMPITQLIERMNVPAEVKERAKCLRFRNTILVYLLVEGANPFPDQWIYVHSPDLKTGRITNFSNWAPGENRESPNTMICLEYWCDDEDDIWSAREQELIQLATDEACRTSLILRRSVKDGKVVRLPQSYPIYASGYKKHLDCVEKVLSEQLNLCFIGRQGAFKYNNQDHSILMGLLAAENIANGSRHDLWAVNTDYEYQENCRLSATGLS